MATKKDTKFKKGKSGNPKGRPKKENSLTDILRSKMDDKTEITIKGKKCILPVGEAIAEKLIQKTLNGNLKAIELIVNRLEGKPLQAIESKIEGDLNVASDERASEAKACIAIIEQRLADSDKCSS